MTSLYIGTENIPTKTFDGQPMTIKPILVEVEGRFISHRDWKPPPDVSEIDMVVAGKMREIPLPLPGDVAQGILHHLKYFHGRQDNSFDCYAFANLVKGVPQHRMPYMLLHWHKRHLPWRVPIGSVVFLESGATRFHHAAIYLGRQLYLSVWGAGGDLEIATLKTMKRDFDAERVMLAHPM